MEDKRCKFDFPVGLGAWRGWGLPDLQASPNTYSKMPSRRREFEGGNARLEGEVVNSNAPVEICQNRSPGFIDGEKKVPSRRQIETIDIRAMRKRKCVRSITASKE